MFKIKFRLGPGFGCDIRRVAGRPRAAIGTCALPPIAAGFGWDQVSVRISFRLGSAFGWGIHRTTRYPCGIAYRGIPWPGYRGTSLIKKTPTPLGPPYSPRHEPAVGSWGGRVSCERGTPVRSVGCWSPLDQSISATLRPSARSVSTAHDCLVCAMFARQRLD